MPNDFCNRASNKVWSTVSNAADRSNKTRKTFSNLSNGSIMSFVTLRSAVSVLIEEAHVDYCRQDNYSIAQTLLSLSI